MKKFRMKDGAVLRTSGNYSGLGAVRYEALTSGKTVAIPQETATKLKDKIEEVKSHGNA